MITIEPMRPVLAIGALLASVATAGPPTDVLTLAVLRRDAIVVPFATYDGKHWQSHWPSPKQDVDVPISLSSVPFCQDIISIMGALHVP